MYRYYNTASREMQAAIFRFRIFIDTAQPQRTQRGGAAAKTGLNRQDAKNGTAGLAALARPHMPCRGRRRRPLARLRPAPWPAGAPGNNGNRRPFDQPSPRLRRASRLRAGKGRRDKSPRMFCDRQNILVIIVVQRKPVTACWKTGIRAPWRTRTVAARYGGQALQT